ncbi:MAG: cation-translocating P-type ATPase [Haloarculaceae archaeon]
MASDRVAGECALCGGELGESRVEADGRRFCSPGCRDVHGALDEPDEGTHSSPAATDQHDTQTAKAETTDAGERAYLRVDGMHSATCEAFLEAVATRQEGVAAAEASYVTETVRVDYDPARIGESELVDSLSRAGYTAYPREEEIAEIDASAAGPQRDPRLNQERGLGDMLGYRYAAGVLFGTFLLLPYVALLYPSHLSALVDWGFLGMYDQTVTFTGDGGFGALRLFMIVSGIVLVFTGLPLLRGAYVSLRMRRPDTNLLVATTVIVAYLYSVVAGLSGRTDVLFDLTVVIAAVVVAAIFYESLAKQRAMDRLTELTVAQVDDATLYVEGATKEIPVESLESGDQILVEEGERVPVDGTLAEGGCTVDEAVVTGESLPVAKQAGDEVVGGSVVIDGGAVVEVGEGATSSVDRLVTSVWDLQSGTHGVQKRANRLTARILPAVAVLAALAATAGFVVGGPTGAALAFLLTFVVACPWALGLAAPLSVATSIEQALRRGIVVFDETVFERLRAVDVVVFDKTGTLTTGEMDVVEADAPGDLLAAAAALERRVSHPAAKAIVAAYGGTGTDTRPDGGVADEREGTDEPAEGDVESFTSYPDGVGGVVDGSEVLVGHPDRFAEEGWDISEEIQSRVAEARGFGRLPVVVGQNGRAEGVVVVGDEPREGWDGAVTRLAERGIDVIVLTGDDEEATDFFREHPGVTGVFAGVPPAGKTEAIARLQAEGSVAMVGDGTNDAPALAKADLGISLGSGTAIASDAADLVVVDDDLAAVGTAFDLARAAGHRLKQNTWLALLYNGIAVPLALLGLTNPLLVMGAVAASGGLVGVNSMRDLLDG